MFALLPHFFPSSSRPHPAQPGEAVSNTRLVVARPHVGEGFLGYIQDVLGSVWFAILIQVRAVIADQRIAHINLAVRVLGGLTTDDWNVYRLCHGAVNLGGHTGQVDDGRSDLLQLLGLGHQGFDRIGPAPTLAEIRMSDLGVDFYADLYYRGHAV